MEEEVDYDENEDEENGSSIDAGAAFDEFFNCHKCFLVWRTHFKTVSALAKGPHLLKSVFGRLKVMRGLKNCMGTSLLGMGLERVFCQYKQRRQA
jgi:hypothetical protein